MRLDRNSNVGRQKYALLKLRVVQDMADTENPALPAVVAAMETLARAGILDRGDSPETEFFVIRLKDKYAGGALYNYAWGAFHDGEVEYGRDVKEMADRAGEFSPHCKKPD